MDQKLHKNCSVSDIQSGLDENKTEYDEMQAENKTLEGRVGIYGEKSGQAQIKYEESIRTCESYNRRQEIDDDIYA